MARKSRRLPRPLSPPKPSFQMRQAATIWFDLFQESLDLVISDDMGEEQIRRRVELAVELADKGLDSYEKRWPGVYPNS